MHTSKHKCSYNVASEIDECVVYPNCLDCYEQLQNEITTTHFDNIFQKFHESNTVFLCQKFGLLYLHLVFGFIRKANIHNILEFSWLLYAIGVGFFISTDTHRWLRGNRESRRNSSHSKIQNLSFCRSRARKSCKFW